MTLPFKFIFLLVLCFMFHRNKLLMVSRMIVCMSADVSVPSYMLNVNASYRRSRNFRH